MILRYGVIGAGMMGREHIRNIALIDGAEVVALADPSAAMRAEARALIGGEVQEFETVQALLDADICDAFVIASPNDLHHPQLAKVIARGKPVLCEKPLGITASQCRDIMLWERSGAPVWVAMEYRYMPPLARLRAALEAGEAGRAHMISIREHRFPFLEKVGHWNRFAARSGGTLVEKCCHFFDLMRLLSGADPARIFASGGMDVNHLGEVHDGRAADMIDNAFVVVEMRNGMRAMLDLCMFAEGNRWQEMITVTGDRAELKAFVPGPARFAAEGAHHTARFSVADRATRLERVEEVAVDPSILAAGDHHGSTFYQHQGFVTMVREGRRTPEVTTRDGFWSVAMGEAAERSLRLGEVISLEGVTP